MMNRIQEASWRLAAKDGSPITRLREASREPRSRRAPYLEALMEEWKTRLTGRR
ncbi:MAG: hypothetical protein WBO47_13580 [Gammaproteobacteria bacterium]